MRGTVVLVSVSFVILLASACEPSKRSQGEPTAPAPAAEVELEAGERVDGATAVPVAEVAARHQALAGKPIKVSGVVKDVCQHRGCWVEIADGEATILAKSLSHTVLLPKDAAGKRIEVEGTLRVKQADAASCEHGGEGHGEHGEEGHSCPSPDTLIEMQYVALYAAP